MDRIMRIGVTAGIVFFIALSLIVHTVAQAQRRTTATVQGTEAELPLCTASTPGKLYFATDAAAVEDRFRICDAGAWRNVSTQSVDVDSVNEYDGAKTDYGQYDLVRDPATGFLYRSLVAQTTVSALTDAAVWLRVVDPARLLPALAVAPTDADKTIAVNAAGTAYELIAGVLHVPVLAGVADAGKRIQANATGDGYELYTPVVTARVSAAEITVGASQPTANEVREYSPEDIVAMIQLQDEIPAWQAAPVTYPVNKLVVFGGDLFRAATGTNTATDPANDPTNWIDLTIPLATALEIQTGTETDERSLSPKLLADELLRRDQYQHVTAAAAVASSPGRVYLDHGAAAINVTLPATADVGFIDFYRSAQATGDVTLVRAAPTDTIVDGSDVPQAADYLVDSSRVWFRLAVVAPGDYRILYTDTPSLVSTVARAGAYDAAANSPDLTLAANQQDAAGKYLTYFVDTAGTQTLPGLGSVTLAVDDILEWWPPVWRLIPAADQVQTAGLIQGNGLASTPVQWVDMTTLSVAGGVACGSDTLADTTGAAFAVALPGGAPVGCRVILRSLPVAATNFITVDPGVDTIIGVSPQPLEINGPVEMHLVKATINEWLATW